VELNPGHFLVWLEQGHCQQALNLVGAAEHSYRQARQLNPDCTEARNALITASQTGYFRRFCGRLRQLFQR
jgi:cytochrome c-type biogenesis protein CcmH/NrfG